MRVLTCAAARRRLEAFHDGELPVGDQIAVGSHLEWCSSCAAAFSDLQSMRDVLRSAAPSRMGLSPERDFTVPFGVIARAQAEQAQSLRAVVHDMFEDMHFVYAGVGAVAAFVVCAVIMFGMMRLVTTRAMDPLVAGSNQNPLRMLGGELQMPRAIGEEGFAPAHNGHQDDIVIAFTAVVTREGRVANVAVLDDPGSGAMPMLESKHLNELIGAATRARFAPASRAGSPVAVNMVWIVTHTTVRGSAKSGLAAPISLGPRVPTAAPDTTASGAQVSA